MRRAHGHGVDGCAIAPATNEKQHTAHCVAHETRTMRDARSDGATYHRTSEGISGRALHATPVPNTDLADSCQTEGCDMRGGSKKPKNRAVQKFLGPSAATLSPRHSSIITVGTSTIYSCQRPCLPPANLWARWASKPTVGYATALSTVANPLQCTCRG